jgi:DNA-binding FadR family transcriptional regulator
MPLREIASLSLADQVFQQLSAEIMGGGYAAGSLLPAERDLSVIFKVNRHVVREALKRLEQVGLVQISQGGRTRVLDWTTHAGLDLLALLAERPRTGEETASFWLSVLEMRAAHAADMVRLCALRGDAKLKTELVQIANDMRAAPSDQALYALEVRFWDGVLEGADNLVYRLAFNSMVKAAFAMGEGARSWSVHEVKRAEYRLPLALAIAAGDAARAETLTRTQMRAGLDAFSVALRPKTQVAEQKPNPSKARKRKR